MKNTFLIFLTIFITGIFLKTEAGVTFKEAQVYPLYRLPDKDITIEWSTPSQDGITISFGDKQVIKESEGKLVLTSSELSLMPETFEIVLKINAIDGGERKFEIQTFYEPRKIKMTAKQVGYTERFIINFDEKEWDNNLVIKKIELDSPKSYYTRYSNTSIESKETQTKWEYYNTGRNTSGYLMWNNQYKSTRGLPTLPIGTWTFRLWNYPWQHSEFDIQPSTLDPDILFTIGAKEG